MADGCEAGGGNGSRVFPSLYYPLKRVHMEAVRTLQSREKIPTCRMQVNVYRERRFQRNSEKWTVSSKTTVPQWPVSFLDYVGTQAGESRVGRLVSEILWGGEGRSEDSGDLKVIFT